MIEDYISEIRQYLPCSYFIDGASDYVEYISNACVVNAEKEKYQFSFLAFHMLYMTFIYKIVWQSNQMSLSGLDRKLQQYEGQLHPFTSPFRLSVINEKDVIKFLRCHGFHSNKTDQFERPVDDRNHCAHASGFVQYRTNEDIESLFKPIIRYVKEIQEKQKVLLKQCFEQYFKDNYRPDDISSLFPSGMDSVNRFIKDRMLSLKDLEAMAMADFDFLNKDSESAEVIYKKVFYLLIVGKIEEELGEDACLTIKKVWPILERGIEKQDSIKLHDLCEQELVEILKFSPKS